MPLAVGNMWEYYVSKFDTFPMPATHYYDTVQIVRDTLINAEQWFVDQDGVGYTNCSDGLWRKIRLNQDAHLALTFPGNIGDESLFIWELLYWIDISIDDMDTLISVPAGDFHCILYKGWSFGPLSCQNDHYIFYAPDIGLIKNELYRKNCNLAGLRERWELVSYNLQQD